MRGLAEGTQFSLIDHSLYRGDVPNAFVALRVTHEAANNLGAEAADILQTPDLERGTYRNQFEAAPATARLVPLPPAAPDRTGPADRRGGGGARSALEH